MNTKEMLGDDAVVSMLDLFERQAANTPDAIAVTFAGQRLTCRELDQRANQLAWHLRKNSVKPETLVGICIPRSLDMVIAILGVLKAGGAYVPLDPDYPKERLNFILEDAQAPVVITHYAFSATFPEQKIRLVCLDTDWADMEKNPPAPPVRNISGENLAYVIYTSGSTGQPKGVMITHSNLLHFIRIAGEALDVLGFDVYLQTASLAYALSVRQIMIPLSRGARLVFATAEEMRDPLSMFQTIKRQGITLLDMVPSFWRACLHRLSELPADEAKSLMENSLRRIVSIGEPLLSDIPQEWMSRFGHRVKLVNIFGQTETTGVVATYSVPVESPARVEIVPIGQSVPGTRLYLLNSDLKPVSPGEQGELCVSSPCVGRGYLNRPGMTAEKFVPNPFGDGFSHRLYRTGDLARVREDGNIEFLGRGDHQVKIRGQRMELGEVESILREHPSVRDVVVTARGDHPDEKYLAAYIIPTAGDSLRVSGLRDFVRKRVPDYMVPSAFVLLDAFPLTPNGKLDRLALPDPARVDIERETANIQYVQPRTDVEKTMVRIWMDILKVERIGIHDDYFELGGNSLLAVRMFTRIERDLGVRLPYTSLFQATTIAKLAQLITNANNESLGWPIVVPIHKGGSRPPFFGIHGHEGGVLFWRAMVSCLPEDQPFYALQARGVDGFQQPLNSIPAMAELYIREIRQVQPRGPYNLGGYSMGGEIAFEMAQQLTRQGERVGLLVLFDTRNPLRSIRPMVFGKDGSVAPVFTASTGGLKVLKRKLGGHFLRLSWLTPREKLDYILNQIFIRLERLRIAFLVGLFKFLKKRLPDSLLHQYIRQNHTTALANYIPVHYPGRVTLFRATETLTHSPDHAPLGWGPLAGEGLDIYHFDATHELLRPEYAREVADRLNECLSRAASIDDSTTQVIRSKELQDHEG